MLCFLNEKLRSEKFGIIKTVITKVYYVITLAYLYKLETNENLTVIVKVFTQVIEYIFFRRKVFTHNLFTGY